MITPIWRSAETEDGDAYLFASKDKRIAFVTGHPEYDPDTLASEYFRDVEAGLNPDIPYNYFPKTIRKTNQSHRAATEICCSLTGSTITSTRLRRTIFAT